MKTTTSLKLATLAALAAVGTALAQSGMMAHDSGAGLLGQKFSGLEYGYTHHVDGPPHSLNRYAVVSQAPLPEMVNLDGAFHYEYTRGSTGGITMARHDVRMGFTKFLSHGNAKPFLDVQAGWAWLKNGAMTDDSFAYQGTVGVELPINATLTATPYFRFEEAPHFRARAWSFGGKLGYRMHRNWSGTLAIQVDEDHNIEYSLGVQRRY
ncbi:MAG: hypothetical protein Q7S40_11875 [Opitutaceae bacterium]|nr:hypothetical protein [Opitutaceae bacterium]